jgi:Icc protein
MSRRYHLPWSRTLHILSPVPVHPSDNDAGGSGHLGARANRKLSRRALLRSTASLGIAAAVPWHASLSAQSSFRFIVVNDLHHGSRECDPFFASLVRQMRSHGPVDFCIIGGDIADTGQPESFTAVREAFTALGAPIYTVPGNHDCDVEKSTRLYSDAFPDRLNYAFRHRDWQFVALDTTEGNNYQKTRISDVTLGWLDRTVPTLDRSRPTILFTHFPLASDVSLAPVNVEDVLSRLDGINLRGTFNGHYHARIERRRGDVSVLTNACCSRLRDNHDGSLDEGYLLCTATADGRLSWEFVEFVAARKTSLLPR